MCYNINSSKYCDNRRRKVKSKDGDRIVANFEKPRYSFIKLDEYGSCVWKQIDGKKTIYEIGKILEKEHKKAGVQLYERLAKYFKILETNKYVVFVNEEDK